MLFTQCLLVICTCLAKLVVCNPIQNIAITESLDQCKHQNDELFCNFKDLEESDIYLGYVTETIGKVYIHNARKLQLSGTFCTNLALQNIGQVVVADDDDRGKCNKGFELAVKNSQLNRVPDQISKLYFDSSKVANVLIKRNLENLKIIDSVINILDISSPFGNNTLVLIVRSHIGTLRKLVLDEGSQLTVKDTNVTSINSNGLVLNDGVITITDSIFPNVTSDAIVLSPKVALNFGNYNGIIKVSDTQEATGDYLMEFIICLIILCFFAVGIITYFIYCKYIRGKDNQKNKAEQFKGEGGAEANALIGTEESTDVDKCENQGKKPSPKTSRSTPSEIPNKEQPNKQKQSALRNETPYKPIDNRRALPTENNAEDNRRKTVFERTAFFENVQGNAAKGFQSTHGKKLYNDAVGNQNITLPVKYSDSKTGTGTDEKTTTVNMPKIKSEIAKPTVLQKQTESPVIKGAVSIQEVITTEESRTEPSKYTPREQNQADVEARNIKPSELKANEKGAAFAGNKNKVRSSENSTNDIGKQWRQGEGFDNIYAAMPSNKKTANDNPPISNGKSDKKLEKQWNDNPPISNGKSDKKLEKQWSQGGFDNIYATKSGYQSNVKSNTLDQTGDKDDEVENEFEQLFMESAGAVP